MLASPRCDALLGAGGSGASLGGATSSRVADRGSGTAAAADDDNRDEEAPLLPPEVVDAALAFAMLQSALSKCWWRWPPLWRLGPFFFFFFLRERERKRFEVEVF